MLRFRSDKRVASINGPKLVLAVRYHSVLLSHWKSLLIAASSAQAEHQTKWLWNQTPELAGWGCRKTGASILLVSIKSYLPFVPFSHFSFVMPSFFSAFVKLASIYQRTKASSSVLRAAALNDTRARNWANQNLFPSPLLQRILLLKAVSFLRINYLATCRTHIGRQWDFQAGNTGRKSLLDIKLPRQSCRSSQGIAVAQSSTNLQWRPKNVKVRSV